MNCHSVFLAACLVISLWSHSFAVELGSLVDGGKLAIGDLVLSDWQIEFLNHTVEATPDVHSIEFQPIELDGEFGISVAAESLATLDADILEFEISFQAGRANGGVSGLTIELGSYGYSGDSGFLSVSSTVFSPSDDELGDVEVLVDSDMPFGVLRESTSFTPASSVFVSQSVVIEGGDLGDTYSVNDFTQLFRLSSLVDIDADGVVTVEDVDELIAGIITDEYTAVLDLNSDSFVDGDDLSWWLADAGIANGFGEAYLPGDANLDGRVDSSDLNMLGIHWQSPGDGWSSGDFVPDGFVDSNDLNVLGINWQKQVSLAVPVPEPSTSYFFLIVLIVARDLYIYRHRRWEELSR